MTTFDIHITEKLIKSTVRIINQDENGSEFVGTGFFFSYNPDKSWNSRIEAIVTNKHVVENSRILKFAFRTNSSDETNQSSIRNYELQNPQFWTYKHPDESVDLCIIFLKPITDYFLKNHNEKLNVYFFPKDLVPNSEDIKNFASIEDVIMIGYPEGIIEQYNLYPIVRKGITASPFSVDFDNEKVFLTDIFAIGGSSGSPVILFKKTPNSNLIEKPYLLGVHYAGLNNNKLNLGVNIKSERIFEIFDSFIELKLQDADQREYLENLKKGDTN